MGDADRRMREVWQEIAELKEEQTKDSAIDEDKQQQVRDDLSLLEPTDEQWRAVKEWWESRGEEKEVPPLPEDWEDEDDDTLGFPEDWEDEDEDPIGDEYAYQRSKKRESQKEYQEMQ